MLLSCLGSTFKREPDLSKSMISMNLLFELKRMGNLDKSIWSSMTRSKKTNKNCQSSFQGSLMILTELSWTRIVTLTPIWRMMRFLVLIFTGIPSCLLTWKRKRRRSSNMNWSVLIINKSKSWKELKMTISRNCSKTVSENSLTNISWRRNTSLSSIKTENKSYLIR